ncbi:MAG: hypothetical protein ABIO05_09955 [Ferruginibacter sp.]
MHKNIDFKIYCLTICICILSNITSCTGQVHRTGKDVAVGGGCDGCEIMYKGMPGNITATDTSSAWNGPGYKLILNGKVFKADGTTPAAGIIIYYWQTNQAGFYAKGATPFLQTPHGAIRGWVKTNATGQFTIYTIRPAPYPNAKIPAHIHTSIKEPGLTEYYIDDFVFNDDPLLTVEKRSALENRGGSGILQLTEANGALYGNCKIILGKNIPGYPAGRKK